MLRGLFWVGSFQSWGPFIPREVQTLWGNFEVLDSCSSFLLHFGMFSILCWFAVPKIQSIWKEIEDNYIYVKNAMMFMIRLKASSLLDLLHTLLLLKTLEVFLWTLLFKAILLCKCNKHYEEEKVSVSPLTECLFSLKNKKNYLSQELINNSIN